MIKDQDLVFVTTTLYTKWLSYQSRIINKMFPESKQIIIDGRNNWPVSWFYWINQVKETRSKYFIHVDEDFFLTSKDELLKVIDKMEKKKIDLMGIPDGLNHYRSANPVAINTFLMIGRTDKLMPLDFSKIQFVYSERGWINNYNLSFKDSYKNDWKYTFEENAGSNFNFEQEPYYAFLWAMKNLNCKFDYLYPHFDDRFKSTNPRISKDSPDIGIHMWYTRNWNSNMDVMGMPNIERYELVEKFIIDNLEL